MSSKIIFHTSRLNYFLIYLMVTILVASIFLIDKKDSLNVITISISLILLIIAEILTRSNDLIMDDNNITSQIGIFSRKRIVIHYSNISDVVVNQSFIKRISGIGEIHINTSGSEHKEILVKNYRSINLIHDMVVKRINAHKKKK